MSTCFEIIICYVFMKRKVFMGLPIWVPTGSPGQNGPYPRYGQAQMAQGIMGPRDQCWLGRYIMYDID